TPAQTADTKLEEKFSKIESAPAATGAADDSKASTQDATAVATTDQKPLETSDAIDASEAEVDLEAAPESSGDFAKYKPLFAENPELKQILGREAALSELQGDTPWSEFKQIHEMVPTLADAETLTEEANNAREFGRIYRESPSEFVENLRESDANAFSKLALELPEILAKVDVNLWRQQAEAYIDPVLQNLYGIARSEKNEELVKAVQLVFQSLGISGRRAAPIANSEVEELKNKLKQRDEADQEAAYNDFRETTDSAIQEHTVSAIADALKQAAPTATEAQMKRMVQETYAALLKSLGGQPEFV